MQPEKIDRYVFGILLVIVPPAIIAAVIAFSIL